MMLKLLSKSRIFLVGSGLLIAGVLLGTVLDGSSMVEAASSYWQFLNKNIYNTNAKNVGIGMTNPQAKLHVSGATYTANNDQDVLIGDDVALSTGKNRTKIVFGQSDADTEVILAQDATHGILFKWDYNATAANAWGTFETYGGNNPLVLQSVGGNVGIGTTAPQAKLDVDGAIAIGGSEVIDDSGYWVGAGLGKMTVVAQTGGNYTSPYTAMQDLSTWCGTPSSTNMCLLKIMPGVYDISTNTLTMQDYVDIEGSGEEATKITGSVATGTAGVVNGSDNAEIRELTIESTSTGVFGIGFYNVGVAPKIRQVTIVVDDGATNAYGIVNGSSAAATIENTTINMAGTTLNFGITNTGSNATIDRVAVNITGGTSSPVGIYNDDCSPTIKNSTITVSGGGNSYGIENVATTSSTPTITNVTISVSGASTRNYGIRNSNSFPTITEARVTTSDSASYAMYNVGDTSSSMSVDRSTLTGASGSVVNAATYTLNIGATKLDGAADSNGTYNCVGAYDENYSALDTSCQ